MADKERNKDLRPSRRDLLSGRAIRHSMERHGQELADALARDEKAAAFSSADTVRLTTRAMACEFSIILNPSEDRRQTITASDALDFVHPVEDQLTVYRDQSDLMRLNRDAINGPCSVDEELFELLELSLKLAEETQGAFTPAARALNLLWRECRARGDVPKESDVADAVHCSDCRKVVLDRTLQTVHLTDPRMGLDLSGIGKGHALDRIAAFLEQEELSNCLIHGGHSSIIARGSHRKAGGWPVGIRHPQFPQKRLATLMLEDRAFSASGSGVQFFRHQGKRYGHIFDPRTGWPVDHILSAVVTAPSAAVADALSTAFYVLPLEESLAYCERHPEITALIFPQPRSGQRLEPVSIHLDEDRLLWH
ncbi:FAD:protein FMN transferase [Rubinisphaera margarita]|uniref:FAD:protein FMN transferase n=1 Tax=Rubinisphaera margarita TaxID=2909586 RepID=UPI001EE872DB|nr:FAD:protein FMN transferase [Rubinisphaera margarita]MCG6157096.1 FAD:protein FMN transferase [Rubinisphaera margarita]